MKNRFTFLLICMLISNISWEQKLYKQEICKCGVTGAGFSTALGAGSGLIDVYIEPGSTIKQAILFSVRFGDAPDTTKLIFNSTPIEVDNSVSEFEAIGLAYASNISVNAVDVTAMIDPTITQYPIEIPVQEACVGCSYNCVYLYIVYENLALANNISSSVYINEKDADYAVFFESQILNSVLPFSPISYATYFDRINGSEGFDGSYLLFNNGSSYVNVGLLAGTDQVNSSWDGGAVKGHFYFQNNQMFGLDDDTPDFVVGGSDGLINVSPFLLPNNTLKWELDWQFNSTVGRYNIYNGFFITHSTPCSPFPITTPKDTTLCQGTTLQLNATGGTPNSHSSSGYEWQPATGLSCTDCPNPVFTADSSMFYTVRIWNTDSCSVVRPLKINVRQAPVWDTATVQNTVCGVSTGSVTLYASPNNAAVQSWTEVGGATQSANLFQNLSGGNNSFYFTDANGCKSADTIIFVPSIISTAANFLANPISGAAPLSVTFTNTSQNATDYEWFINGNNSGNTLQSFVCDTSGTYFVALIAWQHDPTCADTFSVEIAVFDSLVLQIPNVFSPNGDGMNDVYTISSNVPVSLLYRIYNRWGETMVENTTNFGPGKADIWYGTTSSATTFTKGNLANDGTYFYQLEATPTFDSGVVGKTVKLSGFLQVVR